ncbi:MAG: hypothetical protein QF858_01680 [Candidatus Pacebacteria bacterium]|jgi:hypothetical protein|nr:hypothetical protein [bacterium]MDP6527574.1 hypothetical protein [Candidatus Paceibacterota bacterium]MDP6659836.1 hypothetical protein [Candidatus Paceibacterota bacterium]|tara:strand:- start:38432 stop:38743 length:312 start_codon:yes stop_codon:yes gene_type:complete
MAIVATLEFRPASCERSSRELDRILRKEDPDEIRCFDFRRTACLMSHWRYGTNNVEVRCEDGCEYAREEDALGVVKLLASQKGHPAEFAGRYIGMFSDYERSS